MKKSLIVMVVSLLLVGSVSAQHIRGGGHYYAPRTRVIVSGGFYPYYGLGLGGFYPYGLYPPNYAYSRPSKMTMQIEDIKNDYADKIWSVKHDKSLPRKERKAKVHELKAERDDEINDLKRNYYKH
ncbi:MAG: hypothetical protein JWR61_4862 [Ferruginibacter sp.]|uniref:hypothetical protein n=1 Tax=Ferruginibacter sp. TaxID=1940288 RepID=UPI0026586BCA|nr:hypothetical protein [Ferruginibacter sp.]MDB5279907.1 hypothetical protein [Ferruginibacter sp.]